MIGVPENTVNETAEAGEKQPDQEQEQVQSFSQDDVNRIVQERLQRERDKFSDYDDLKAAAEHAQELESEKRALAEKVAEFEAQAERSRLVAEVSETTGVPADVLRGETKEELESHADVLRSLISTGPVVRGQEKRPDAVSADPLQEFARNLFAQAD